jgi:outer membrane protein TolC
VRAGSAKPTDVLLALAQSTRARRDLNEARFQRAMSWLELELATGADPVALTPGFSSALHGR